MAHKSNQGFAVASHIAYTKDSLPGPQTPGVFFGFGAKTFEVTTQYVSTYVGAGYDVAQPDFNRKRLETENFGSYWNLFNAGGTVKTTPPVARNGKFLLADILLPPKFDGPRWEPDRLYLSVSGKSIIEVFDIVSGNHLKTITTPKAVSVMASYFSQ